jgi:hypothetical protein
MTVRKKKRVPRPRDLETILRRERGDVERMHAIAKSLDSMRTKRSRMLALAFFVARYDECSAERMYQRAREELDRLKRPGEDW